MGRRTRWAIAAALLGLANGPRDAAAGAAGSPQNVYDYRFEVRAVEHGDTLYRVIMETLREAPAEMEFFPDARYEVALGRGRMEALLRAMFDASPPR